MRSLSSSLVCVSDSIDITIKKIFANPQGLEVKDKSDWVMPNIGDRVEITSYDTQVNVQECVRVSKLSYVTVKDVNPVVVGIGNDNYAWAYDITIEESYLGFMQWHYRVLN